MLKLEYLYLVQNLEFFGVSIWTILELPNIGSLLEWREYLNVGASAARGEKSARIKAGGDGLLAR